jgi:hypothetical protein
LTTTASGFSPAKLSKTRLGLSHGALAGVDLAGDGNLIDYRLGACQGKATGETSRFSPVLNALLTGDLLLADRYYGTCAMFAWLQSQGIPVRFPLPAHKKAACRHGRKPGANDPGVEGKKPERIPVGRVARDDAGLPELITVRELKVKGVVSMTTLLKAKHFNKQELASCYKARWKIEWDVRTLKTHRGLELVRCKTPERVPKDIAVPLWADNIIRGNLAQAAVMPDKLPRPLSFRSTVQRVCPAAKQIGVLTGQPLTQALWSLLKAIASTVTGLLSMRNQPRALKRRPKPFPLLTLPRHEACLSL